MRITNFKNLIISLPVLNQSFTTKRKTWKKFENNHWLKSLNDEIFGEDEFVEISRKDVFNESSLKKKIIKAIYWGYPRGMRGNNFRNILSNINLIESAIRMLINKNNDEDGFNSFVDKMKKIPGIGLSTYSKILYFCNIKFLSNSSVILDKRIIDQVTDSKFDELKSLGKISLITAPKKFIQFLDLINKIAREMKTNAANVEQFLFIFGTNLK